MDRRDLFKAAGAVVALVPAAAVADEPEAPKPLTPLPATAKKDRGDDVLVKVINETGTGVLVKIVGQQAFANFRLLGEGGGKEWRGPLTKGWRVFVVYDDTQDSIYAVERHELTKASTYRLKNIDGVMQVISG